jgi:hypothetical protein
MQTNMLSSSPSCHQVSSPSSRESLLLDFHNCASENGVYEDQSRAALFSQIVIYGILMERESLSLLDDKFIIYANQCALIAERSSIAPMTHR